MAECSQCQSVFDRYAPLKLDVVKSGSELLVYAQNMGKNIIIIERMLLCGEFASGGVVVYIRQGGFFDFYIGGGRLEQGLKHLKFRITWPDVVRAQAEAEYIEITGRCTSKCTSF